MNSCIAAWSMAMDRYSIYTEMKQHWSYVVCYSHSPVLFAIVSVTQLATLSVRSNILVTHPRAVAADPLSPVSTGPLSPSLTASLVSPISAIAQWTPTQGLPKHVVKLVKWLQTVRKTLLSFLPTTCRSSKRMISFASLICEGCGLWDKQTIGKPKPGQYCMMKWAKIHTCHVKLPSGLQETSYWAKNVYIYIYICPRSNFIASKLQKVSGGAVAFCAGTTNLTASNLMATSLCPLATLSVTSIIPATRVS